MTSKSVIALAKRIMEKAQYASITYSGVEKLAEEMKKEEPIVFELTAYPDVIEYEEIKLMLLTSAVDYCSWYCDFDLFDSKSQKTLMYAILGRAYALNNRKIDTRMIEIVLELMVQNGIRTMVNKRLVDLRQTMSKILPQSDDLTIVEKISNGKGGDVEPLLDELVRTVPVFADDPFYRKALAFFIQLYKKFGWFGESVKELPMPADHLNARYLYDKGCIHYIAPLYLDIKANKPIEEGSRAECEIRATTVLSCQKLSELTGWSIPQIDTWFWLHQNECVTPFHLTRTTAY